jgi:hypothetical protein
MNFFTAKGQKKSCCENCKFWSSQNDSKMVAVAPEDTSKRIGACYKMPTYRIDNETPIVTELGISFANFLREERAKYTRQDFCCSNFEEKIII